MPKPIGDPTTVTLQRVRDTTRFIVNIAGKSDAPEYFLDAVANYVVRDESGKEVGRDAIQGTIRRGNADLSPAVRQAIEVILADLDLVVIKSDTASADAVAASALVVP